MQFTLIAPNHSLPQVGAPGTAFLRIDNWDDWGKYRTQFQLTVYDEQGKMHVIGNVKIAHHGLQPGNEVTPGVRAPTIDETFHELNDGFFSLGQGESYYEGLNTLSLKLRLSVLTGLRDAAYSLKLFEGALDEDVMHESLLRDISSSNVRNRYHRLAKGDATLTPYEFEYVFPPSRDDPDSGPAMSFVVTPDSVPPTNVHVLIGRNGVGKTYCMQNIGKSLLGIVDKDKPVGQLLPLGRNKKDWSFAGLVSVSFSAFDEFEVPKSTHPRIVANAVGLRVMDPGTNSIRTKSPLDLAEDFTQSFGECRIGLRAERWRKAVTTLSNDPVFADANVLRLLELGDDEWEAESEVFFHKKLSSGHKIVLLTITRLVELVDERTLVLLDEPEGHLHPPLLSAFIRSLTDLLIQRNGVAIIATHSPVVLQEVPKSCAWLVRRAGHRSIVERPSVETFGENVGLLTREIFGLEVTSAGFHKWIRDYTLEGNPTYDQVMRHFGGQLGAEARAIIRGFVANRDAKESK